MKQSTTPLGTEKEIVDLPTIVTILCHLMTLYALRPCEPLATNINRHIMVLLKSSAADSLGEWKGTFQQLLIQWENIAKRHVQHQVDVVNDEAQHIVSH